MRGTSAVVRFRGRVGLAAQRLAVVEFPPSLRTVLVYQISHGVTVACRCQMPYQVFVIFYNRWGSRVSLDTTSWNTKTVFSRVCHFFRDSPMTSIDSTLCRDPFPNQYWNGAICFGDDAKLVGRLYATHPTLHGLVQTVTESFWGTTFSPHWLQPGFDAGSRRVRTFADWEKESRNPHFLDIVNWETPGASRVHELFGGPITGRFNPGRHRP